MRSSPVMRTHRASSSGMTAAIRSRIAISSAPRLPGLEMTSRVTPGAGSSIRSCPAEELFEDNERVALGHGLTLAAADLLDDAGIFGLDRHLHLHRFENHDRIALVDGVANLNLDLPHGTGDVRFDVGQIDNSS